MKVILRQNIESLGQIGDVVDVKNGYAQNYLIPRKYAYAALNVNLKALEEEKQLKQQAEKQHEHVESLASRAQQEHEQMITLITKLDNLIKRVNEVQENIVNTKIKADDVHREFITHVDKIHELERSLTSEWDQQFKRKRKSEESSFQKEANDIFERFKRGEKLSTEDLMALQKAGLI